MLARFTHKPDVSVRVRRHKTEQLPVSVQCSIPIGYNIIKSVEEFVAGRVMELELLASNLISRYGNRQTRPRKFGPSHSAEAKRHVEIVKANFRLPYESSLSNMASTEFVRSFFTIYEDANYSNRDVPLKTVQVEALVC
jgi:hypothetical protein